MMGRLELVCPAGTPAALRTAVDAGADTVYLDFRDETNARNFPGLNFNRRELAEGLDYAHARGAKVYVAINTFPRVGEPGPWRAAVDDAARLGADAAILDDIGLLDYADAPIRSCAATSPSKPRRRTWKPLASITGSSAFAASSCRAS
jgi:collagenase-like PrtC family protease